MGRARLWVPSKYKREIDTREARRARDRSDGEKQYTESEMECEVKPQEDRSCRRKQLRTAMKGMTGAGIHSPSVGQAMM